MAKLVEIEGTVSWDVPAESVPLANLLSVRLHERGFAPAIQIGATIDHHNYEAAARRHGGIDLAQPGEGAGRRRKKSIHVANPQHLIMFLGMVERQAREYYGENWGI